jgi:hypothetical protein
MTQQQRSGYLLFVICYSLFGAIFKRVSGLSELLSKL